MRFAVVVVPLVFVAALSAQEGSVALPDTYKVQFENAWVKVTSVRYEPMQTLPAHAHTPSASAYVYLNDGPPVRFRHIGGHNAVATRPATRAGAFRVYRGLDEVHEVENTGNVPSEFLRVELKTMGVGAETFRGKFERPAVVSAEPVIHFDHPQLRIARVWVPPGKHTIVAASSAPALVIALKESAAFKRGQERWVASASTVTLSNETTEAIDFLRFDFKTAPLTTDRR